VTGQVLCQIDPLWSPARRARVVRTCTALVGDADAAEDLAQESLLQAWRIRDRLVDPSGVDAWLDAVARNVCRRWLRAKGSAALPTGDDDVLDRAGDGPGIDDVLERQEIVEVLDRVLALVPAPTREALIGHYVEELSHADIARRLGCSADAVSMRISRGRASVRHLLETRFADDPVAEPWASREDAGWRRTRLRCAHCGTTRVLMRYERTAVSFRCGGCDPTGVSVHVPLEVPGFHHLLGHLRRPSAILARLADWSVAYWHPVDGRTAPCVRCGETVKTAPYTRPDMPTWSVRRGWYAACEACGQEVSGSVAGLASSLPAVREARRREPRLLALPVRDVVRDGHDAKVVSFGTPEGRSLASAVFLNDSLRLVHVDA